ncbi:uncharacterized protein TNCV_4515431 [Trichonephila clavipes]|nr:uncharacterized protein TNCV_4515431 [Trichonephila clavipes]
MDQILSSALEDYLQQGIPSAHTQEPQVLDTGPSLFDESNYFISFLDHFEAWLALKQQEAPMDLTMPRLKKKVKQTTVWWILGAESCCERSSTRDILTQQHVSSSVFAHANVFHHGGQPVPIELSIASISEDGPDPKVICITVDHSNLLTTDKDRRANRYINERLSLKSHLPGSVPLEYLDFGVRGKFCHLAQGNSGHIVVKGSDQRKIFEKLGLFTINLEILPHFHYLNDRTQPDHLHDEVHEDFDISEYTMVKSYRFARYLQHFNKLQAECKRQTAHLVE